jgi:hypothetical protein
MHPRRVRHMKAFRFHPSRDTFTSFTERSLESLGITIRFGERRGFPRLSPFVEEY